MALKVDIEASDGFFKGTNFTINFTVKDATGAAQDITGWSLEYTMRRRAMDPEALVTKTVGSGITLTSPATGQGTITMLPADTASLRGRVFRHALRRTDSGFASSVIPGRGHAGASVTLLELV